MEKLQDALKHCASCGRFKLRRIQLFLFCARKKKELFYLLLNREEKMKTQWHGREETFCVFSWNATCKWMSKERRHQKDANCIEAWLMKTLQLRTSEVTVKTLCPVCGFTSTSGFKKWTFTWETACFRRDRIYPPITITIQHCTYICFYQHRYQKVTYILSWGLPAKQNVASPTSSKIIRNLQKSDRKFHKKLFWKWNLGQYIKDFEDDFDLQVD